MQGKRGAKPGTFGSAPRLEVAGKVGFGSQTPSGTLYYARCSFEKEGKIKGRSTSMGGTGRPQYCRGISKIGPGSYTSALPSVYRQTSPLDGPAYCKSTIKHKSKYVVGAPPSVAKNYPGPAHYELNSPFGDALKYSIRFPVNYCDAPHVTSIMRERGKMETTHGKFGKAERPLKNETATCGPNGDLFFSHSQLPTVRDYLKNRTTTMGIGRRSSIGFKSRY